MWKEPTTSTAPQVRATAPQPAVVVSVAAGSIAEDLGFEAGDRLLRINGVAPRDLVDYRILISAEDLDLEVLDATGEKHLVSCEKDLDADLGLEFSEALFDGLRQCNNRCAFCFIDQQPPGKRSTLYLKDDDYRLSFLYGSYLTLTNLTAADWQRIEAQRLSPLYVSVHATDPALRSRMLGNERAGLLLQQLQWFAERGLQIHAQVVVCPGVNDGEQLQRTLDDLFRFAVDRPPTVLSTAVVPVGLTRFRPEGQHLLPVTPALAERVIRQVERLQAGYEQQVGSRFAWLADEWYLMAGQPLPERAVYEDLPQQDNGVGSLRAFFEALDEATAQLPVSTEEPRRCSWVVGALVGQALEPVVRRLNGVRGVELHLHALRSPYWGQDQVVTGLLTGADLVSGLRGRELGDRLLLPSVMLRHGSQVFLDDLTVEQVSAALAVPIRVVEDAQQLVAACIGTASEDHGNWCYPSPAF